MFEARLVPTTIGSDLRVDSEGLLESIRPGVKLVMLANPNQPTGTIMDEPALLAILDRARAVGAMVAIDEAYYPFSKTTMLPRIREWPHLVVVRTFSKAAGLAGVRVGFAAGHPEAMRTLSKVRSVHDVNAVAAVCAQEILRSPEVITDFVEQVEAGGQVLAARASELGLEPLPTHANFMLIRVAHRCPPSDLVEAVRRRGYLVRGPFSAPAISECIRVTLGAPQLMSDFSDSLAQALDDVAAHA
jgi:histidinol-phosphate aminotransferase